MILLGVDPGFGITGYGVIDAARPGDPAPRLLEAGVLRTDKGRPIGKRLREIHDQFLGLLKEFRPAAVALEEIFSLGKYPRSGIQIGYVHGIVLLACDQAAVPVHTYFPLQVKRALLGYGHGTKAQTQRMVQRTLGLAEPPRPDDVADALAVALCHANRMR